MLWSETILGCASVQVITYTKLDIFKAYFRDLFFSLLARHCSRVRPALHEAGRYGKSSARKKAIGSAIFSGSSRLEITIHITNDNYISPRLLRFLLPKSLCYLFDHFTDPNRSERPLSISAYLPLIDVFTLAVIASVQRS